MAFSLAACEIVTYVRPISSSPRPGGRVFATPAVGSSVVSYSSTQLRSAINRDVLMNYKIAKIQ